MDYVILSIVILGIGVYGLLTNRQLIKVFISIELIAVGATLNFVMLTSTAGQGLGQAFLILALLVIVSKKYGTSNINKIIKSIGEKAESEAETQ